MTFIVLLGAAAFAHNGPPFPIITDKKVGPCTLSLWTHPDVGTGTFFVIMSKESEKSCENDVNIEVGVRPVSGRLAETRYKTWRDAVRGQTQFKTEVQFDRQEVWNVHLILKSPHGDGEATASVEATPPGLGRWDLLFYASPFLFIAVLWVRAISRRKRRTAA